MQDSKGGEKGGNLSDKC